MKMIKTLLMIPILIGALAGALALSKVSPPPLKTSIVLIGTISIARGLSIGISQRQKSKGRLQAEAYYHQTAKEIGVEAYTPQELRAQAEEERRVHNSNVSSLAFWAGSNTYIDFDGYIRDTDSNQVIGDARPKSRGG
jgi:hypothetical protein